MIAQKVIMKPTDQAKIVGNDKVDHKLTIKGILLTAGSRKAIEEAGGNVVD
jgi:ribosomal protein L15